MKQNKLTAIIDGNWLLLSRVGVMRESLGVGCDPSRGRDLQEFLSVSLSIFLQKFPEVDNLILVSDGGSWRKSLFPSYKSSREKSVLGELDWELIWRSWREFRDWVGSCGFLIPSSPETEGDDQVWYWSRHLSSKNISSLIWSSDRDLTQLVLGNLEGWVGWYEDRAGLKVPHLPVRDLLYETLYQDFGNALSYLPQTLTSIQTRLGKSRIEEIDPSLVIFQKVFCGDSSDSIPSVITYLSSFGRKMGVGKRDVERVLEDLGHPTPGDLARDPLPFAKSLLSLPKFKKLRLDPSPVIERLRTNLSLVWLDASQIPTQIRENMEIPYQVGDLQKISRGIPTLL